MSRRSSLVGSKARLADALRQLEGSKAIEDALQSELNTTLAAYAQSKEGNQKIVQVQRAPTNLCILRRLMIPAALCTAA